MPLRLYNTRSRSVEPFRPLDPGHVRIYVCGLTPSAEAHLGHARSFLFFDVLRRYLAHPRNGYRVTYVQNVTDVDDRSIATAQREGTTFDAVIARYYGSFKASMRRLGVAPPDVEPYATKSIPEIQAMIEELVATGHAYPSRDGIYFAVGTFARYGELSGKNVDELLVGARIAENEDKRDPLDFALWKFARAGEPAWPWHADSPLAASAAWSGRPGWHIECSAMIADTFGLTTIDIHGGGYDLIFPHHENEVAQSESLIAQVPRPRPLANFWVHGGLLNFEGRKMSKSLGNFEPLFALLDRHDPLAIRLLFLQTGYRKPMNFTEDSIAAATVSLEKLQKAALRLRQDSANSIIGRSQETALESERHDQDLEGRTAAAAFRALDDDMDTAQAVGILHTALSITAHWRSVDRSDRVLEFARDLGSILGLGPAFEDNALDKFTIKAQLQRSLEAKSSLDSQLVERLRARLDGGFRLAGDSPEAAVQAVIEARAAARKSKDFALGDRLRDALAAEGIVLKDSKDGTTWTVAAS